MKQTTSHEPRSSHPKHTTYTPAPSNTCKDCFSMYCCCKAVETAVMPYPIFCCAFMPGLTSGRSDNATCIELGLSAVACVLCGTTACTCYQGRALCLSDESGWVKAAKLATLVASIGAVASATYFGAGPAIGSYFVSKGLNAQYEELPKILLTFLTSTIAGSVTGLILNRYPCRSEQVQDEVVAQMEEGLLGSANQQDSPRLSM